ncbi:MAG: hypothetical protein HRT40_08295 [Campylobacteraceae bacterium]|nr:hypothetical protein [Campylobacteraceae bacterium]
MIPRIFLTKEQYEKKVEKGEMPHKTYEEYLKEANKLYDELELEGDEEE